MSLSDIRQKILDDAKKEAEQIKVSADQEAEKIVSDAHEEAKQKEEILIKKGDVKIEQMRKKVESLAKHHEKTEVLDIKRRKIAAVFSKAKDSLKNLSPLEKERILIALLASVDPKEAVLHPVRGDEKVIESAMKKAQRSFRISDPIEGMGGFFLVAPDYEIDCRFDAIIDRELSRKMEGEISSILFQQ